jgi:predicted kinase
MRRLPEKRMLRFLLETGQANAAMLAELAALLADFHGASQRCFQINPNEYVAALEHQWIENLAEVEKFPSDDSDREALEALRHAGAEFIQSHENVLTRRIAEGWIRDVHGDLNAEHICFAPEGIQIFDCVEFSKDLRRCDLASEIAFLSMDLAVRGGESLRASFLAAYGRRLCDPDMAMLLPFFESYRALVRAKVQVLRGGGWNDEAASYLRFAQRFTWSRLSPFVVMICGFSGTGKSTLARALSQSLGLPVYNSDLIRKSLTHAKTSRVAELYKGIYAPPVTEKTYANMAALAKKEIRAGRGVLLDATFNSKPSRNKIARVAELYGIPLLIIRCQAPERVIRQRVALRELEGGVSDARWDTYLAQKAAHDRMDEFEPGQVLELSTEAPLKESIRECERFLRSRLSSSQSRSENGTAIV